MAGMQFFTHPYYQFYAQQWQLSFDLYEGHPSIMRSKYLTRFALEDNSVDGGKAFAQRAERTYYTNYKKAIEQLWITYIFQNDPETAKLVGAKGLFTEEEARNIDGQGTSLVDFIKLITSTCIRYGWCYVHVDSPPLDTSASQQSVLAQGIRPFAWVWSPLDVPDWQDNVQPGANYGQPEILHREFRRPVARKSLNKLPEMEYIREQHAFVGGQYSRTTYRRIDPLNAIGGNQNVQITQDRFTNQYIVNNSNDWEQVGDPQTAPWMERMPIVRSIQEPWTFDVDQKVLHLYQLESSLDNILYYQAYTRVAIAGSPGEKNPKDAPASENTVIWLAPGSQVFQIASENSQALTNRCADTKNAIFRLGLYQLRQLNAISNAAQAADSQREEKANTYAHAKCRIQEVEDTIYQFFELWASYKNIKFDRETFSLRKNLTHEDLEDFLMLNDASAQAQDEVPELKAEMRKKMVEFLELDDSAVNSIKKAIEVQSTKKPESPSTLNGGPKLQRDQFAAGFNGN